MKKTSVLPATLLALAGSAHAASLYLEEFTHTTASPEVTTATVGWTSYYTTTAQPIPNPTSAPRMAVGNQAGIGTDRGYLFVQGNGTSHPYFGFEATAFSIAPADIFDITFRQGNNDANLLTRLAIRQNGNWYATNSTFSTTPMDLPTFTSSGEFETFAFTTAASAWRLLTVDPGNTLSLAGTTIASDLSTSAPVTSVGFYTESTSAVARWDNLSINSIPEPSAALLGALGSLLLLRRKR